MAQIAFGAVNRLVQSTGNLYWTSHSFDGQHNELSVWRTGKTASPGDETQLWGENAGSTDSFGALTYANVGGTWYGYFVANYWRGALDGPGNRTSVIKRVPLAGGPAVALRTSTHPETTFDQLPGVVGQNDLVTDGSYLYWADAQAIRRMPIGGGGVATLANGTALGHVALDDGYVYYTSGTTIRRVPKTGGFSTILEDGVTLTVSALAVVPGSPTVIYWGWTLPNGRAVIYSKALSGGVPQGRWISELPTATVAISATVVNEAPVAGSRRDGDADRLRHHIDPLGAERRRHNLGRYGKEFGTCRSSAGLNALHVSIKGRHDQQARICFRFDLVKARVRKQIRDIGAELCEVSSMQCL
jgi:hypothetical protein